VSGPDAATGSVRCAAQALADGRPVLLTTACGEGNLVCAAQHAGVETVAFLVRHTSGFLCVALPEAVCERLALPSMRTGDRGGANRGPDYRVTVDASERISTGISARDRARTISLLAAPGSGPATFTRPGHVVPVAARAGGVLVHQDAAEAGVDLTALAGLAPAALFAGVVSPRCPERMAGHDELLRFSADHRLPLVSAAAVATHLRTRGDSLVARLLRDLAPRDAA
jgi:3,4-dihydroxy 2-butanone 4-phosphate synthase/GTP cyclohydrolase II